MGVLNVCCNTVVVVVVMVSVVMVVMVVAKVNHELTRVELVS